MTENESKIAYSLRMMVNKALERVHGGSDPGQVLADLTEHISGLINSIMEQ